MFEFKNKGKKGNKKRKREILIDYLYIIIIKEYNFISGVNVLGVEWGKERGNY